MTEEANHTMRAADFDITAPAHPRASAVIIPALLDRRVPVLQSHTDAFETMNCVAMQTLRYVDSVGELEFDITRVIDYDGSIMEDRERLFLSVCCSVFSSFSFCTTLQLDLKKLVSFLREIFSSFSSTCAYHNALHAADSLQMLSLFLREPAVNFLLNDEEMLHALLGILVLDVAHLGMHNSSLAASEHPLVAVFGSMMALEQSSLLVFLHKLLNENNFFLGDDEPSQAQGATSRMQRTRETLCNLVVYTSMQWRPHLMRELSHIHVKQSVQCSDVPGLLTALLVLSSNSFALRQRRQYVTLGGWFVKEMMVEVGEMKRRQVPCLLSDLETTDAGVILTEYCTVIVKTLADAVRALVPTDLYDNLERNVYHAISAEDVESLTSSSSAAKIKDVTWSDNSSSIIYELKKAVTHANSLDRKASKCAILNASPMRSACPSSPVTPEWRSSLAPSHLSHSLILNVNDTSQFEVFAQETDIKSVASLHSHQPNRAEHYFSFLRLYDKCERESLSFEEFSGQLIFLALQLDPSYIASYARELLSTDCCSDACSSVAITILQNEEPPSTSEVVASRHVGSALQNASTSSDTANTDGFILFLMNMYCRVDDLLVRATDTCVNALNETADTNMEDEAESSTSTQVPNSGDD